MKESSAKIYGFNCDIFSHAVPGEGIQKVVVLLHGYCGTKYGLAKTLFSMIGSIYEKNVAVVFPQAKILVDNDKWAKPGATAWWKYSTERLSDFESIRRPLLEREEEFPGLMESARALKPALDELRKNYFKNCQQLTIGGFSMGAILATEIALDPSLDIAILGVFSGTLTREKPWTEAMNSGRKLAVVQSHGISDHILDVHQARELSKAFKKCGHTIFYYESDVGHVLQKQALIKYFQLVENLKVHSDQ